MAAGLRPRGEAAAAATHSFATNFRRAVVDMLVRRADDTDCHPQPNVDFCEKPGASSKTTTWIIVGVVIGVVLIATFAILIFLHLRRRKRDKREDMEDRYQRSDYGLDEIPAAGKPRPDVSPSGYGRRSRDPLQVGTEPKYPGGGQLNGHLNPFDDASSFKTGNGSSYPPSVDPQWPKRESSQQSPPTQGK